MYRMAASLIRWVFVESITSAMIMLLLQLPSTSKEHTRYCHVGCDVQFIPLHMHVTVYRYLAVIAARTQSKCSIQQVCTGM